MAERFLVVGLGSIGRRHAANLHQLRPGCSVAAFRSGSTRKSEPTPDICEQFTDWRSALSFAPSAAIICNPAPHHLKAAKALLEARVPMLIEKPIADTTVGIRDFAEEVRRSGVTVAIGYNLRFLPSLMRVRRLINERAIGEVVSVRAGVGQYLPDWRPQSRYQDGVSGQRALGGGPLLELSHELDYLYWMFGLPAEVTALGARLGNLEIDVDDTVELTLTYAQPKRLLSVHLDFLQRTPDRRCRFIGSDGTLVWDALRHTVDVYRTSTGDWERLHLPPRDPNQPYLDELSAFLDPVASGSDSLADLDGACDVLAIAEAAQRSIEARATVKMHDVR